MQLYSIDAGRFKLDGGAMFGVVPKSMWNKLNPADENNLCSWALRCLLVIDGNRKILIDTGAGTKQSEKFFSHYQPHGEGNLISSLKSVGLTPDNVTDVILTHLHFDHCGGAVSLMDGQLLPTFPNATYWTNEKHWEWAVQPNPREKASFLKENILPLKDQGKLQFIPENETGVSRFNDHLDILFTQGHTRSMMLPMIRYKERTIVYMADLIPSSFHISLPFIMSYDLFPYTTLKEKEKFLNDAVAHNYVLFFEHDPLTECATVELTEKGFKKKETFELSTL